MCSGTKDSYRHNVNIKKTNFIAINESSEIKNAVLKMVL